MCLPALRNDTHTLPQEAETLGIGLQVPHGAQHLSLKRTPPVLRVVPVVAVPRGRHIREGHQVVADRQGAVVVPPQATNSPEKPRKASKSDRRAQKSSLRAARPSSPSHD